MRGVHGFSTYRAVPFRPDRRLFSRICGTKPAFTAVSASPARHHCRACGAPARRPAGAGSAIGSPRTDGTGGDSRALERRQGLSSSGPPLCLSRSPRVRGDVTSPGARTTCGALQQLGADADATASTECARSSLRLTLIGPDATPCLQPALTLAEFASWTSRSGCPDRRRRPRNQAHPASLVARRRDPPRRLPPRRQRPRPAHRPHDHQVGRPAMLRPHVPVKPLPTGHTIPLVQPAPTTAAESRVRRFESCRGRFAGSA